MYSLRGYEELKDYLIDFFSASQIAHQTRGIMSNANDPKLSTAQKRAMLDRNISSRTVSR